MYKFCTCGSKVNLGVSFSVSMLYCVKSKTLNTTYVSPCQGAFIRYNILIKILSSTEYIIIVIIQHYYQLARHHMVGKTIYLATFVGEGQLFMPMTRFRGT